MKLLDKARAYIAYKVMPETCACGHPKSDHKPSIVFKQGTCDWNECKCGKVGAADAGQSAPLDVAVVLGKHAGIDFDAWIKNLDIIKRIGR